MKLIIWISFNDKDVWVEDELRKNKQSFSDYCHENVYIIRSGLNNLQIITLCDEVTYVKCFELFKQISKDYYGKFRLRSLNDSTYMKLRNNVQVMAKVYQSW